MGAEPLLSPLLSVEAALARVLDTVCGAAARRVGVERVLLDGALGRVLAAPHTVSSTRASAA
jgi:hypothetical protein